MKPGQWRFVEAQLKRVGFQVQRRPENVLHAYVRPTETGSPVVTVGDDGWLHLNFRFDIGSTVCSPHVEAHMHANSKSSYDKLAELVRLYEVMRGLNTNSIRFALEVMRRER